MSRAWRSAWNMGSIGSASRCLRVRTASSPSVRLLTRPCEHRDVGIESGDAKSRLWSAILLPHAPYCSDSGVVDAEAGVHGAADGVVSILASHAESSAVTSLKFAKSA